MSEELKQNTFERDFSLDLIKLVSCILIIMLHSPFLYEGMPLYIYRSITAVAVPTFMAVSGYLIFYRKSDYGHILKQVFRLSIVFIIWWVVYVVVYYDGNEQLYRFAISNSEGWHLWYLVIYIKILLFYPFVKLLSDNKKLAGVYSILWVVLVALRFTLGCIGFQDIYLRVFNLPLFQYTGYLGGTILGYYPTECLGFYVGGGLFISFLKNKDSRIRAFIAMVGIVSVAATVVMIYSAVRIGGETYFDYALQPMQINVVVTTISFIASMLLVSESITSNNIRWIVTYLSEKTFGVYIIHSLIYRFLRNVISGENLGGYQRNRMICLLTICLSFSIVSLVHRLVPYKIRRYIF